MHGFVPRAHGHRWAARGPLLGVATLLLAGCVFQSTYNNMLQQQQAIEASLRSEIAADQVNTEIVLRPR